VKRIHCKHVDRSGSLLVVVLICLGIIGALLFTAMQSSLKQRQQLSRELQMEQTRLLAEAALAYGVKQAKVDPDNEKPIVLQPKFAGEIISEVKIEMSQHDTTEAQVTASIGLEDRPELRTRIILTKKVENSSGE